MIALAPIRTRPAEVLARRLGTFFPLSAEETSLISGLDEPRRQFQAGEVLEEQGNTSRGIHFIVSGWAGLIRTLPDGRRQIFRLMLPGDLLGTCGHPLPAAPCSTVALTPLERGGVGPLAPVLRGTAAETGRIAQAAALLRAAEEAWLLDHVMRLGCQTALERTAHLLLELRDRLVAVGLGSERQFPLPLTQETIADVLGLSTVHMNRILQDLRRQHLLKLDRGMVTLPDPARLGLIADYTPAAGRTVS